MPLQFYVPHADGPPEVGMQLTLSSAQAQHITQVLRQKAGAALNCFDGRGTAFTGVLQATGKRSFACLVEAVAEHQAKPRPSISMALALLKGDAMDRSILLASELGADQIILFPAARSNVRLQADRLNKKLEHWQKIVIGACEQSGRLWLPELSFLPSLVEVISPADLPVLALQQGGERVAAHHLTGSICLLVGPEGGWQGDELELFDQREIATIGLADSTLRAETVPAAALTLVNYLR